MTELFKNTRENFSFLPMIMLVFVRAYRKRYEFARIFLFQTQ